MCTSDDPQESFNVFNPKYNFMSQCRLCLIKSSIGYTMYRVILLRILRARFGELRKPSNSYKIDVRIFKAQLISGST